MFVASWCAPCRSEIARVEAIADAARPMRVLVVPVDAQPATAQMMRQVPAAHRWQPDPMLMRRIRSELLSQSAGLPLSVAIGADGRTCGIARRGLDASRAAALLAECKRD